MLSDFVAAGQIVEIQAVNPMPEEGAEGKQEETGDSGEKKVYRTKVFDVLSEDQLEIMMPIEKGKVVLLPVDGEFDLCFYAEKGLYQCYARVLDRYKSHNVYIVVMELSSNLRKHQRREFYRFGCALGMNSRLLEKEEIAALEQDRFYVMPGLPLKQSVVVDISGGGLRFIGNCGYEAGDYIYCTYTLNVKGQQKQYHMAGKILSVRELEDKPDTFEYRIQYTNPDVDEREEIIKYIFEEERRQRHKATSK